MAATTAVVLWLALITFTAGQILNTGREDNGICGEMLCNSIESLMHLSNCVVVLGDLKLFMEKTNTSSFRNIQFPELREVTGYMVAYRMNGLESLGQLFPNLTRIRGTHLIYNFGLVVHDMPNLKEVGLYNLLKIDRGGVVIWGGVRTCYISTVDWDAIAPNSKHMLEAENIHCKNTCTCGEGGKVIKDKCWNSRNCQRFLEGPEAEAERGRCHPQCLGCGENPAHCSLCRNYTHRRKCVADCPRDTLILKDNQYCVTVEECKDLHGISFNGTCLLECPVEYTRVFNPIFGVDTCTSCQDCHKTCGSLRLQALSTVQKAEGCVYINGSLTIHIRSVPELMEELRRYLSRIQEVSDYIVIYGSMTINSLDFFPSLKVIKGRQLLNKAYSLIIHDMENLTSLFPTNVTKNLRIERGKLRVLRNPMLCKSEIDKVLSLFPETSNETDLPFEMNGYARECDGTAVDLHVQVLNETSAMLTFSPLPYANVQYTVLYVKLPSSPKKTTLPKICSDSEWYSMSASSDGVVELKYLRPASTYALCIETFVFSDQPKERKHSRSNVVNFTTPVGKPAAPFITEIYATSSNNVTLRWVNHKDYRPHISHYELDVSLIEIHPKDVAAKDHCKHIEIAVEDSLYSRHMVVLRPPEDYDRNCESLCNHLTSTIAAVVPEEPFKVCDSEESDDDINEASTLRNTSFNNYIRTAAIEINSNKENYEVRGLAPFRDYRFRLRACVGSRCSVFTRSVVRTLRSQEADVPSKLKCSAMSYNSILVEWDYPNVTNGPVLAYIVHVLPIVNGEPNITLPETFCVPAIQHNLVVKTKINSMYQIRVCGTTLGSVSACSGWSKVDLTRDNSFLWGGLPLGVLLTLVSIMIGYSWRTAPDRSDRVPLVEHMFDNHNIESESTGVLISTDSSFEILYTVPLRDTQLDH